MIRRVLWLALGAGAAYWVLRRIGVVTATPSDVAGKAAGRLTSLAGSRVDQAARLAVESARDFADQVRVHSAEREAALRAALTADVADPAHPGPGQAHDLLAHPRS